MAVAALVVGAVAAVASATTSVVGAVQAGKARGKAQELGRQQVAAQEALVAEQERQFDTVQAQRAEAAQRASQLTASRQRSEAEAQARRSRRQRQGAVGRAGQGSSALLGTPLAGGGIGTTGGKTLLGL